MYIDFHSLIFFFCLFFPICFSDQKKNLVGSKGNCATVSSCNHVAEISNITSPGHHNKRPAHETAASRTNISHEKPSGNHLESSPFKVLKSLYDGGNKCSNINNNSNNNALVTTGFLDGIHSVGAGASDDSVNAKNDVDVTSWDIPEDETNVCEGGIGGDVAISDADGKLICDDNIDTTGGGDSFLIDYFIGSGVNVDDDDDIVPNKFSLENHRFAQSMPSEPPTMTPHPINDELNCWTPSATSKAKYYPQTPKPHNHHLQITKDKFLEESTKEEHEPRSPLKILRSDNWASHWRSSFTIDDDDSAFQLSDNDPSDNLKLESRSNSRTQANAEENQIKEYEKILDDSSQEDGGKKKEVGDLGRVEVCQYSSQLNDSGNLKKPSRVSVGTNRYSRVGKENICRDAPRPAFKSQVSNL